MVAGWAIDTRYRVAGRCRHISGARCRSLAVDQCAHIAEVGPLDRRPCRRQPALASQSIPLCRRARRLSRCKCAVAVLGAAVRCIRPPRIDRRSYRRSPVACRQAQPDGRLASHAAPRRPGPYLHPSSGLGAKPTERYRLDRVRKRRDWAINFKPYPLPSVSSIVRESRETWPKLSRSASAWWKLGLLGC